MLSVSVSSTETDAENEWSRYLRWLAELARGRTEKGRGGVGIKVLNLELKWNHRGFCQNMVGCSACWVPKYSH